MPIIPTPTPRKRIVAARRSGRLGDASHGTHTADGPFGCTERSRIGQNAHQHEPDEKGGGRD